MKCRNQQCGKELGRLPTSAPHKRFCCQECRQQWHLARRREAMRQFESASLPVNLLDEEL